MKEACHRFRLKAHRKASSTVTVGNNSMASPMDITGNVVNLRPKDYEVENMERTLRQTSIEGNSSINQNGEILNQYYWD